MIASSPDPTITAAEVAAGHDGQAEITLSVRYRDGGTSTLTVPGVWLTPALDAAGITTLDQLIGRSWTVLIADLVA